MKRLLIPVLGLMLTSAAAIAQGPEAERGHRLVQETCGMCHAVEAFGDSPLPIAPRFRDLNERYDVGTLEEALVEGIITGHPTMPEFAFEPIDAAAIIEYLKTL